MKRLRLVADAAGESRWCDEEVPLAETAFAPPARGIFLSAPEAASSAVFLRLPAGWNEPPHASPHRQILVCTRGAVRVTASDGEVRTVGPGDIWLMEDTSGAGHHTEVTGAVDFEAFVVQLR